MRSLRTPWRVARPAHLLPLGTVHPSPGIAVATRVSPVFRQPFRYAAHIGVALLGAMAATVSLETVQIAGSRTVPVTAFPVVSHLDVDAGQIPDRLVTLALLDASTRKATAMPPPTLDPVPRDMTETSPSLPVLALLAQSDRAAALPAEAPGGQVIFQNASLTLALSIPIVKPSGVPGRSHDDPVDPKRQRLERLKQKVHFNPTTRDDCLPKSLLGVLYDIADLFGDVHIASTYRDPRRNARVGGATRSMHLHCRAIDFRVGGNRKTVLDYIRKRPEVGGYKLYPLGFFHIDNGPRRSW